MKRHSLSSLVILLLLVNFCFCQNNDSKLDSIQFYIEYSKDKEYDPESRLSFAKKASELAYNTNVDSLILMSNRNFSVMYFTVRDFDKYVTVNRKNYRLAKTLKDTSALQAASNNLGTYYRFTSQNDSTYYYYTQNLKYSRALNDREKEAAALFILAGIQELEKDYTGAEEKAVIAIKIFRDLPKTEYVLEKLSDLNNLMGIVSRETKNYDKSIEYYNNAIDYARAMDDGFVSEIYARNNKAFVYRTIGDFDEALRLYQSLIPLKSKYDEDDPSFYPLVINNIAYTRFVAGNSDYNTIKSMFEEAYKLSDSLKDDLTKMAVAIDMSKFHMHYEENESALRYAEEAYNLSSELLVYEILMDALKVLSDLKEGEEGKAYLKKHIRLGDSLLDVERNGRNKFARIEFETDELEAENLKISRDKLYLSILSIGLMLTAILIYIVINQRARNKELQLVQEQQRANEEIYNLMLEQQDKVDEARTQEKKRISEELHDGVLGRLFGARLSLDSLNFVEGMEAIKNRSGYISQLKTIEDDIRQISHELNTDFVSGSGFVDIVSELIENQTQAYGLEYDFYYTDDISWENLSNKTKINIYRIIQESMQNIYKHANAKQIKISITLKNNVILLAIADDGDGFDSSRSKKGIGLKNMTSRVEDIEGSIAFNSKVGMGTTVNVKIPYTVDIL